MPPEAYIIINIVDPICGGSGICMPTPVPVPDTEDEIRNGCDSVFDPRRYPGTIGRTFRIRCPKNCPLDEMQVYGSEIYYWNSSICGAAIHNGKIQRE